MPKDTEIATLTRMTRNCRLVATVLFIQAAVLCFHSAVLLWRFSWWNVIAEVVLLVLVGFQLISFRHFYKRRAEYRRILELADAARAAPLGGGLRDHYNEQLEAAIEGANRGNEWVTVERRRKDSEQGR
jgi:hypothetical protein